MRSCSHVPAGVQRGIAALFLLCVITNPARAKTFEYVGGYGDQMYTQTVVWSIAGIPDEAIEHFQTIGNDYYYVAPIAAGFISVSASTEFALLTNGTPVRRAFWIDIPYGSFAVWRSGVDWNNTEGPCPASASFTHSDPYEPGALQNVVAIEYVANDWLGGPVYTLHFRLIIMEPAIYALGSTKWILGTPYPPEQPRYWYRKPDGCNGCSSMGLPGFAVHPGSLNLALGDVELRHDAPGPDVSFSRSYNGIAGGNGMFGPGWSHSYESWIESYVAGAKLHDGDGRVTIFTLPDEALPPDFSGGSGVFWWEGGAGFGYTNSFVYSTNWSGVYINPASSRERLTLTCTNGVWQYSLRDPDTGWTREYTSTQQLATIFPLTAVRDDYSNRISILYVSNRISAVIDGAGRTNHYFCNAGGLCTNIQTASGDSLNYAYNAGGRLAQSKDLLGSVSLYSYNPEGYLTNLTTEGRSWTIGWDTNSYAHVSSVTDPLGAQTLYHLMRADLDNREIIRFESTGSAYTHSADGLVLDTMTPLGCSTAFSYTNGLPETITDPFGRTRSISYTEDGRLKTVTDFDGGMSAFGYDAMERISRITNASGKVWQYGRDSGGGLTNLVTPGGREIRIARDSKGNAVRLVDPAGATWRFDYDRFGNVTQYVDSAGYASSVEYDANGLLPVSATDARGHTTFFEFDANHRLIRVTHPDGTTEQRLFDCCAETGSVDENGRTNRVWRNALLAMTQRVDRTGARYSYRHSTGRDLVSAQDDMGITNTFTYDADHRLETFTNGMGHGMRVVQDCNGRITEFWPRTNVLYSFQWSAGGNLSMMQPPDYGTLRYFYNSANLLYWRVNGRNQNIFHTYDDDRHLVSTVYEDTPFASWEYDSRGLMTNMADRWGTTAFHWDTRHQIQLIAYPDGLQVEFGHDEAGLISSMQYPGGFTAHYQRDARNRVTNMVCGSFSAAFTLDSSGRMKRERYANGADIRHEHDAEGRITNLAHAVGTTNLLALRCSRNACGTITNIAKLSGLIPYRPVFARGAVTGAYNNSDAQIQWGGQAVQADLDGNITSRLGGVSFTARYDPDNRLVGMTRPGVTNDSLYNGLGQRVRTTRNGVTQYHHYDIYGRLLFTTGPDSSLAAVYLYRDFARVGAWFPGAGFVVYHFDETGNTIALTGEDGQIAALYRYTPYGAPAGQYARVNHPFTWLGRYGVMDEGDGIYAMPHRWYDATSGRFLQMDPASFAGGLNLYAYANANPVRFRDPSGLKSNPLPGLGFSNDLTFDYSTPLADDCAVLDFDPHDRRPGLFEAAKAAAWDAPNKVIPFKEFFDVLFDPHSSWLDAGWELTKEFMGTPGNVIDVVEDAYQWKAKADQIPAMDIGRDGGLAPAPGEEGQW